MIHHTTKITHIDPAVARRTANAIVRSFPGYPVPTTTAKDWRSLPDWPAIHRELRRKGVTLQLIWEEYRAAHPDGYGRSWFCELYRAWEGRLSPTMRQAHVAGEKLFVDYAGTTIDIVDAATGEVAFDSWRSLRAAHGLHLSLDPNLKY